MEPIIYKGYQITTRKNTGMPFYYAFVYGENFDKAGFTVGRSGSFESREIAIDAAKREIDLIGA